jgi:hypothetical protein
VRICVPCPPSRRQLQVWLDAGAAPRQWPRSLMAAMPSGSPTCRCRGRAGYLVEVTDPAEGKHCARRKQIEISGQLEPDGQLAASMHEVGHVLLALDDLAPALSYAGEELVVESVGYCVCRTEYRLLCAVGAEPTRVHAGRSSCARMGPRRERAHPDAEHSRPSTPRQARRRPPASDHQLLGVGYSLTSSTQAAE